MQDLLHRRIDHAWFPYLFLDAIYLDVRHRGRVVSPALVVATGVSGDGRRETLGMALRDAETMHFWTAFLRGLCDRGLKVATDVDPLGVTLVISDAHAGGLRPQSKRSCRGVGGRVAAFISPATSPRESNPPARSPSTR